MKIVEISASLGNGLKRYNVFTKVSMKEQPFSLQETVLYGVTKPTDIVQTNAPTNILIDIDSNPIGTSQPVYFGIRVYPFVSAWQNFSCKNNTISYGDVIKLTGEWYFLQTSQQTNRAILPLPYTGELYPQPEFVPSIDGGYKYIYNYKQEMQQFINDCVFPTKPNLDLPGQTISASSTSNNRIPYFNPDIVRLSELHQREPRGVLSCITDEKDNDYETYMAQFDGQNLNFKFGMATNSDFAEPPKIYLPYLYRTYCGLFSNSGNTPMGVIMQCLLYDSNGNVISA